MPIVGVTDRKNFSFLEIGRIRLGISKASMTKGPKELPYFRVEFRKGEEESESVFRSVYGNEPTRINIRLPFQDTSQVWDANYEMYGARGMTGMADGERWTYLLSPNDEVLVRDGQPYTPFDKTAYPNAKMTGRLKVVIPELQRVAYLVMITHSYYNIVNLTAELAGIQEVTRNIAMVPLVLVRRPETISVNINGKKSQMQKHLVHVEVNTEYFTVNRTFAITASHQQLALPEPQDLEESEPEEYIEEQAEPEQPPEPESWSPPTVSEIKRPYDAVGLKAHLLSMAAENESEQKIPQKSIGALVANLNYVMPEPKDGNRHAFINWVFGIKSCNDLTWGQGKALKTWLNVAEIDGKWIPAAVAMVEAKNVIDWLNKNQPKLFD